MLFPRIFNQDSVTCVELSKRVLHVLLSALLVNTSAFPKHLGEEQLDGYVTLVPGIGHQVFCQW